MVEGLWQRLCEQMAITFETTAVTSYDIAPSLVIEGTEDEYNQLEIDGQSESWQMYYLAATFQGLS